MYIVFDVLQKIMCVRHIREGSTRKHTGYETRCGPAHSSVAPWGAMLEGGKPEVGKLCADDGTSDGGKEWLVVSRAIVGVLHSLSCYR